MGRLCAAGLATMEEMLDPNGPWNVDLIETMLPVAIEIETKREQAFGRALISAVASFSKSGVWKEYSDSLEHVLSEVRQEQLIRRGATRDDLAALAAEDLVRVFSKLQGMKR